MASTLDYPFFDHSVPLSHWDVAYALNFEEANKAIKHYQGDKVSKLLLNTVKPASHYNSPLLVSVSAHCRNWQIIGSVVGDKIGMLVEFPDLIVGVETVSVYDEAKDKDVPKERIIECDNKKYVKPEAPLDVYKHTHPVGLEVEMALDWYDSGIEGKHELKVTNDEKQIKSGSFIRHPDDIFVDTEDPEKPVVFDLLSSDWASSSAARLIGDAIVDIALDEFNYVFATIDYTQTASKKVEWLTLTSHYHSIVKSGKAEPLPKDATAEQKYKYQMDPKKGYDSGAIMIVGMTQNRTAPPSLPSILDIIPKDCDAGYAYNENLIIPNLLYGHLSQVFVRADGSPLVEEFTGDKEKDKDNRTFVYVSNSEQTSHKIANQETILTKFVIEVDIMGAGWKHPMVLGIVDKNQATIEIKDGTINYELTMHYMVKGHSTMGWGLPYDVEVTHVIPLCFNYALDPVEKFASLTPTIPSKAPDTIVRPSEHPDPGFWSGLLTALVTNLIMAGLTMGSMMLLSGMAMGAKVGAKDLWRRGSEKWKRSKVASEEKGKPVEERGYEPSKEMEEFEKRRETMVIDMETHEESIIAPEDTEDMNAKDEKGNDKVSARKTMAKTFLHLLYFTFLQTMWEALKNVSNIHEMDNLKKKDLVKSYKEMVLGTIAPISWGGQDQSTFEVIKGGLTNGSFVLGLDLKFKHDKEEPTPHSEMNEGLN
jgi:hypothetical protein